MEKAKNRPPEHGRYLLSESMPPLRPQKRQNQDGDKTDERDASGGDPDDGWTPDPDRPFSNAIYYYGSERWEEARSAFEEALEKTEVSRTQTDHQHLTDSETAGDIPSSPATTKMSGPSESSSEIAGALLFPGSSNDEDDINTDFKARCHNGIGLCWMMQNRFSDGLASFDRAIEHDPSAPSVYHNRAKALHELGRDAEAEADELKEKHLVQHATTETKGWLRMERGVNAIAAINALRAELMLPESVGRPSGDAVNSEPNNAIQISARTGDDENDVLDTETPVEVGAVHGYEGAQHAFAEASGLDPNGDMVPLLGDSHEKLYLQAQLGPIMEIGARYGTTVH